MEAEFLVDGQVQTFQRTYREIWATRRGTGTPVYEGNTSDYFVNGVPCKKIAFNAARQASFQSAAGSSIKTYFDIKPLGTSYYQLTPISGSAILPHTDYLRFSMIGEGENLIITINEPIE